MHIVVPTNDGQVQFEGTVGVEGTAGESISIRFGPPANRRSILAYFSASQARHFAYLLMAAAEELDEQS